MNNKTANGTNVQIIKKKLTGATGDKRMTKTSGVVKRTDTPTQPKNTN